MVIYHVRRDEELHDQLRIGVWPLTKTLAGGTASLARRLTSRPDRYLPDEPVECELMDDDDLLGWMPGGTKEVA